MIYREVHFQVRQKDKKDTERKAGAEECALLIDPCIPSPYTALHFGGESGNAQRKEGKEGKEKERWDFWFHFLSW